MSVWLLLYFLSFLKQSSGIFWIFPFWRTGYQPCGGCHASLPPTWPVGLLWHRGVQIEGCLPLEGSCAHRAWGLGFDAVCGLCPAGRLGLLPALPP